MARQNGAKVITLLDDVEKCEKEIVESLIELLRGLDATDLELFNEMLPRLVEWKGGK